MRASDRHAAGDQDDGGEQATDRALHEALCGGEDTVDGRIDGLLRGDGRARFERQVVVSIVSAVTAGLLRHYDVASRVGAAEAATIELDNLRVLLEFERIPVTDALTRYQQSVAAVPFVDGAAAAALMPATAQAAPPTPSR